MKYSLGSSGKPWFSMVPWHDRLVLSERCEPVDKQPAINEAVCGDILQNARDFFEFTEISEL